MKKDKNKINLLKLFQEKDKFLEGRIKKGIEKNRKGLATITIVDMDNNPIKKADIEVKQISHDFQFGCNLFMLGCHEMEEDSNNYKEAFKNLFNLGIAPFYWSDLEPEPNRPRFSSDSEYIYRRPAPDTILDYCDNNNIDVKGHPLLWHNYFPEWLPSDKEKVKSYIVKRFKEIAEKYQDRIYTWDVVNETLTHHNRPDVILPENYVEWCFEEAEKYFPYNKLMLNEVTQPWWNFNNEYSPYYMLIENQLLKGSRIDGIGLQYHLFMNKKGIYNRRDSVLNPEHLFKMLDRYSDFNLPIHISEITVPTFGDDEKAEQEQAEIVKNLYRIWFSQSQVEAIVWWNLYDGSALNHEDKWGGGLLRKDFSPKPSYKILKDLINNRWKTELNYEKENNIKFKGFYGNYKIKVKHKGKEVEKEFHLSETSPNKFDIKI